MEPGSCKKKGVEKYRNCNCAMAFLNIRTAQQYKFGMARFALFICQSVITFATYSPILFYDV